MQIQAALSRCISGANDVTKALIGDPPEPHAWRRMAIGQGNQWPARVISPQQSCSNIQAVTRMLIFEWSDSKNRANRRKHGVSFEAARRVFDDPNALMLQDRVEEGEERWQAIGRIGEHSLLVVAHVVRMQSDQEIIRIISARYALKHERQRYERETQ